MEYVVNITAVDEVKNAAITVFTVRFRSETNTLATVVSTLMDVAMPMIEDPAMPENARPLDNVAKIKK